ncbi:MAG TPA: shikimate dehydrogenase [Pyrinomonadaceae bacterium]|nr:shikimate dehydrogenase [Pyrinomonadaceae bacterium]
MNDGKICISICAATAEDLFAQIERAKPLADVIEVRFDCLAPDQIAPAVANAAEWKGSHSDNLLATFRSYEQGGKRKLSEAERSSFWLGGNEGAFWAGDLEEDIIARTNDSAWRNRICSAHDFSDTVPDMDAIVKRLESTSASHIKIAVQTTQITDAIQLWNLLEKRVTIDKPFIPIAMGEAGKWTRILGLAHGAFMTYASLDAGAETAPGQISAADMIDVFRAKELDAETQIFGIVAGDTSYSVSPWMHNAAFKAAAMNRVFVPLQVADLGDFLTRMVKAETREVSLNFGGFSVTNPHKQAIMQYLDEIDETASQIGAVNTVKIDGGKFYGYNTDAPGFIAPLKKHFGDLKDARVSVVGAGGAARACIYALKQEGADVTLFARDTNKAVALADAFDIPVRELIADNRPLTTDILVNTTPLGTKGETQDKTIAVAEQLKDVRLVYDLIYNPIETRLINEAKTAGVPAIGGLEMLIAQGAKQFEIWTGQTAPLDAMSAAVKKKLNL